MVDISEKKEDMVNIWAKLSVLFSQRSWEEEMGSGPGTAVEKGPRGNVAQREAGEEYPPQGLCQAGLGHRV